jgi:hypothetical protein
MLVLPTTTSQLQPGQRVAVFPHENASGETLGYIGTVFAVRRRTERLPPDNPDAWTYVVRGPGHACIDVTASQLLIASPEEGSTSEGVPFHAWQVRFDGNSKSEYESISGRYSLARRSWASFDFVKHEESIPRYELRLPANPLACETPSLFWYAPADAILDRDYVMRMLSELLGPEFQRGE